MQKQECAQKRCTAPAKNEELKNTQSRNSGLYIVPPRTQEKHSAILAHLLWNVSQEVPGTLEQGGVTTILMIQHACMGVSWVSFAGYQAASAAAP